MFESVLKISRRTFDYILSLVREPMIEKATNFTFLDGYKLSLNEQVAISLRRLGSGDSLVAIGESFGIHRSTVSQVTWCFVDSLEESAIHHLQWPSTEQEMSAIKAKFEAMQGLPNCCGAIDITHIKMMLSSIHAENKVWQDRMQNHSVILQAIVDPELRFRDVVTGWPGQMQDASVLCSSTFYELCEKGSRLNGNKLKLADGSEVNEYIVGDSGFPLLPWLVTPYRGNELSESKANFNKRHYETWMVAHRALARFKEGWKVLQGSMWRPDKNKLPGMILACCILHNIVIDMEDKVLDELMPPNLEHDPGYNHEVCKFVDENAAASRDKLALYLSSRFEPQVDVASNDAMEEV